MCCWKNAHLSSLKITEQQLCYFSQGLIDLRFSTLTLLFFLLFISYPALSLASLPSQKVITIAVASNFKPTLNRLSEQYQQQNKNQKVVLSSAATGVLFTQIRQGAPYDAFFSADSLRPKLLEHAGLSLPNSRITYAHGQLVLWAREYGGSIHSKTVKLLLQKTTQLSIANPKTAPYGLAAQQVLQKLSLWPYPRLVMGHNIAQTLQFIQTGNAAAGFVAKAQLPFIKQGQTWEIPQAWYQPIEQQAIILKRSQETEATQQFFNFIRSKKAQTIIKQAGYDLPK
ncbi:molybdate ABC transporter substrate-binding protein [Zooshikella harenae]|uniref:Molybdate ABC transporter substrate-binding protein n=1 Tax=Zooshikella harenae TaxID=2827238 RepID=A0ABS5ZD37_9GAMM|nr:molybdate ABC transporter substrate-binding protein [Zooshikella harenae]MBU2711981.1 molybdate ABC transporter substrate-binding protein [Zooshikella harenae]